MTFFDNALVRRTAGALTLTAAMAVAGCNFDVSQPGRAEDSTLNDPAAFPPLVSGMGEALSEALWQISFITAETSREYVEGGRIFTTKLTSIHGALTRDDGGTVGWTTAQQARWVAEDGIRRFHEQLTDYERSPLVAQALVHAGFANRLLGETTCESVINGGAAGSNRVYFERALANFTEAITVATAAGRADLATAALGKV